MLITTASSRLLFIGDSITDCGRRQCPEEVGSGYVRLVRDHLLAKDPSTAPVVLNRGVSGNKIPDLQRRWTRDVLDLRPDILSIYIGINDVWHGLVPGREGTSTDAFIGGFRDLLAQTRAALPGCGIVLCEPSVLWLPTMPEANGKLAPYIDTVRTLAREFAIEHVVPLHDVFNRAREQRPTIAWTSDGVHPTSIGHMLIARAWLGSTGLL
jgi:lysophospholipase L1-like esterase